MYQDYLDDIIRHYRRGAGDAGLPQRLIRPTPANIREECLAVCQSRFDKKDLRVLTAFFAVVNDQDAMLKVIDRCDIDRFKPLVNYLKKKTNATDDLNVELLAWLIDFPNRPYKQEEYSGNFSAAPGANQSNTVTGEVKAGNNSEDCLTVESENAEAVHTPLKEPAEEPNAGQAIIKRFIFPLATRKITIAVISPLLLTLVAFYFVIDLAKPSGIFNKDSQQCMMWVGDHYVPTPCQPRRGDTVVTALDMQRVKNFKKINREDTISMRSLGRVWYIKRNGKVEYYTAGGRHPVDPNRVLRPITAYMIEKYKDSPQ